MRRFLTVFARQKIFLTLEPNRAPKKAKQENTPQSDDLINIFKDRKDPEIKEIDHYPIWLLQLALPILDPRNAILAMKSADQAFIPEAHDANHLRRTMKRLRIIEQNQSILTQINQSQIKKIEELKYNGNINIENKVKSREEELALAEKERSAAEELKEEEEDDDEEGPKKVRVVVDREKERKEEEEFKAKLVKKTK